MPNYSGVWTLQEQYEARVADIWDRGIPVQELYAWGDNGGGQLGLNIATTLDQSSPVQVGTDTDWDVVSAAEDYSLAIKTDGTLWSWGDGGSGKLGHNNTTSLSFPVQIGALTNWSFVDAGSGSQVIAIKTDGSLWVWGSNSFGRLGTNDTVNKSSPVQIGTSDSWISASQGSAGGAAVTSNGELYSWGVNQFGEVGNNTFDVKTSSPVQIGALTNWAKISCGLNEAVSVKADGTIWSWGRNNTGGLGLLDTVSYSSPVQIGALTNWDSAIFGEGGQCIALKTDSTLWGWGVNNRGHLGDGTVVSKSSPVQIGSEMWSEVGPGSNTSLLVRSDGTLWGTGENIKGSLGLEDNINRSSPVQIGSEQTWNKVAGGQYFFLATTRIE